jgi:hypothetical protein
MMSRLLLLHHGFHIKLRICCDHFPISSGHQKMKITTKKTKVKTVFKTQLHPITSLREEDERQKAVVVYPHRFDANPDWDPTFPLFIHSSAKIH